jgi:hypothetical protein
MKKIILSISYLVFIISLAEGYDNNVNHQVINENAAKQSNDLLNVLSNLGFNDKLEHVVYGKKIYKWFHDGAREEDIPLVRTYNHFHDPTKSLVSAGLDDYIEVLGIPLLHVTGDSSVLWAQAENQTFTSADGIVYSFETWSWPKAMDYYYQALTSSDKTVREQNLAYTFRALGQVMHLLSDSAVPDHVRNEAHASGWHYEKWCEQNSSNLNATADSVDYSITTISLVPALSPITNFWDTMPDPGYNINPLGLAEYTNYNFLSRKTIFKKYLYPQQPNEFSLEPVTAEDGKPDFRVYFAGFTSDEHTIDYLASTGYLWSDLIDISSEDLDDSRFNLDDNCFENYASLLIPHAVGYSAGLLNYFFRGQLEIIIKPNGLKVKNMSTDVMDSFIDPVTGNRIGNISIYYDDTNNERNPLASYELSMPLVPGEETPVISFTSPSNNIKSGRYIVVFYGKLGTEEGAVIGKVTPPMQIYYVSTRNGVDKIYKMEMDGVNLTLVYDNQNPDLYIGKLTLSPDGNSLAFAADISSGPANFTIYRLDLIDGTLKVLTKGSWPDWSPDGKKIVFQRETGQNLPYNGDVEIFTIDLATETETQLTNEPSSSYSGNPAWSPDGNTIAYSRFNEPQIENCYNFYIIYLMDSSGNQIGPLSCQTDLPAQDAAPSWSPDGTEVAFIRQRAAEHKYQLYKVNVGTKKVTKLTDSTGKDYQEYPPSWADANIIALGSQRDGDFDIWVVDSNGGGYLTNLTDLNPEHDSLPAFSK